MFDKRQFLDSCEHETKVIQHLVAKVTRDALDYRPSAKQRSMLELLRYMTTCAIVPATALVAGHWDDAEAIEKASDSLPFEDIGPALQVQMDALRKLMGPLSEFDLEVRDSQMPWGTPVKLGQGLVDTCVKTLTAYRMQLFLYAKASCAPEIGPTNCWVGRDARPQAATS
jgi:hypothetical protein